MVAAALGVSRERQCHGKRQYRRKRVAKHAARHVETAQRGGRLEVYRCPWCRFWHLGHRVPSSVRSAPRGGPRPVRPTSSSPPSPTTPSGGVGATSGPLDPAADRPAGCPPDVAPGIPSPGGDVGSLSRPALGEDIGAIARP